MRLLLYPLLLGLAATCSGCGLELWDEEEKLEIVDIIVPETVDAKKDIPQVLVKLLVKNYRESEGYVIRKENKSDWNTSLVKGKIAYGITARYRLRLFTHRGALQEAPVEVPVYLYVGGETTSYTVENESGTVSKTITITNVVPWGSKEEPSPSDAEVKPPEQSPIPADQ